MMQTRQEYAEKFIETQVVKKTCLVLVFHAGAWHKYTESVGWRETKEEVVRSRVVKFLWGTLGKKNLTESFTKDVLACVKAALSIPDDGAGVPEMFLTFDNGNMRVSFGAGWVSTRTHLLHVPTVATALAAGEPIPESAVKPVDSSLFTRGMIPCNFDPEATCPRWEQFVAESCPEDGDMLQMMFGLSLTYDRRFNVFFVIHGEAGTGKSTALDVLATLSAGVVCGISLGAFGDKFQKYHLTNNRLNLVQDMDSIFEGEGSVTQREAVLKSCTAGEMGQVEQKYMMSEHRRLCALPVFGCNALPRFADRSGAIARRMRIITFPHVFYGTEKQDLTLADTLRAELSGILNWAFRGHGKLLADGCKTFPETTSASAIKANLIKSARPEEMFCDEMLIRTGDPKNVISSEAVYMWYQDYCQKNGYKPVGKSRVIPEIYRYMDVEKSISTISGSRRRCLKGVKFIGEFTPGVDD